MFERPDQGERALLVHFKKRDPRFNSDFGEFVELVNSAGAEVIDYITCSRDEPDKNFFVGRGKADEIKLACAAQNIDIIIVNASISPSQERNLEKYCCCRVLDRTGLILDIFAQRARTFEGNLQVELAQLHHQSTRLVRGWTHLERQKGGIGLRGPGETQLETDRRLIRARIKKVKQRLDKVRLQRNQNRQARQKADIPTVSLVGYTNAGKSSLFNALTSSEVFAADQLFATLDPTLRVIQVPMVGKAILVDTVGFIRDLPHELIDAFKATLEETKNSDLILNVIDCHDDLWQEHKKQVEAVLYQIGAISIPTIEVYNKIDLVTDLVPGFQTNHNGIIDRVKVSAKQALGLNDLLHAVAERLCRDIITGRLVLHPEQMKARARLYQLGAVYAETVDKCGDVILDVTLQQQRWASCCKEFAYLSKQLTNFSLNAKD